MRNHAPAFVTVLILWDLGFACFAHADPIDDPAGDALFGGISQGVLAIDLTSTDVGFDDISFFVELRFTSGASIAAPSSSSPSSLTGAIEFDLDQDRDTGTDLGFNDLFRPAIEHQVSGLGVDAAIDLTSESQHPGLVDVVLGVSVAGMAPITYEDDAIRLAFPRSLLNDAGLIDYAVIIGDFSGPTDAAPATFGTSSRISQPFLQGDYNGSGAVGQGDLDLVLLNWGEDGAIPPAGWVHGFPSELIDQDELDGVLLNWGRSRILRNAGSAPEPPSGILLLLGSATIHFLSSRITRD